MINSLITNSLITNCLLPLSSFTSPFFSLPPFPFFHTGRPLSHASTEESSDRSSFVEERQDDFVPPEDDPVLQQTTVVVKAVMELSNKVPLSRPTDYVEFVKVSERGREGMAKERGKIHNC